MRLVLFLVLFFSSGAYAENELPHDILAAYFNAATERATLEDFPHYPEVPSGNCFFTVEGKEEYYQRDAFARTLYNDGEVKKEIIGTHYELTHFQESIAAYQNLYQTESELIIEEIFDSSQLIMTTEFKKIQGMLIARIKFDYQIESYMYCK